MDSILDTSLLPEYLEGENTILLDARSGPNAKQLYEEGHLSGAFFIDLDTHLANIVPNPAMGGRHPLPPIEKFVETLNHFGICTNSHVIIYDNQNGANAAARTWWMLKAIGMEKVQVLNGGIQYATSIGLPLVKGEEPIKQIGNLSAKEWCLPQVNIENVDHASLSNDWTIIDVRSNERYKGITEPIDSIAGHIPNAVNIPLNKNLDNNGLFLSKAQIKELYQPIFDRSNDRIIVHCGSGVTACHTLLAMDYAGYKIPNLYVGSWSEWSRNNRPIATE